MPKRDHAPAKDRRDIGQVVFIQEKMAAARHNSSCCVGVEAALEADAGFAGLKRRLAQPSAKRRAWLEKLLQITSS